MTKLNIGSALGICMQISKKRFGGGAMLRELVMAASKATYLEAYEEKMNQIKERNNKAYEWLATEFLKKTWCKYAFSVYSKCDVIMNNMYKCFNSVILPARDKPIIAIHNGQTYEKIRLGG